MIMQSPILKRFIKKRAADFYFYFSKNFGPTKALASNTNNLDGLNLHCMIINELPVTKNRDVYDLIKLSL